MSNDHEAALREAAQAVVDRWDTPLWKDAPATAEYINRLRAALARAPALAATAERGGDTLIPCPFCGSSEVQRAENGYSFWVCCNVCGASTSESDVHSVAEGDAKWNRRATDHQRETPHMTHRAFAGDRGEGHADRDCHTAASDPEKPVAWRFRETVHARWQYVDGKPTALPAHWILEPLVNPQRA